MIYKRTEINLVIFLIHGANSDRLPVDHRNYKNKINTCNLVNCQTTQFQAFMIMPFLYVRLVTLQMVETPRGRLQYPQGLQYTSPQYAPKSYLSCFHPLYRYQQPNFDMYGLLTKREVKMFFFCVCMDLDFISVHKHAKKEHLDLTLIHPF